MTTIRKATAADQQTFTLTHHMELGEWIIVEDGKCLGVLPASAKMDRAAAANKFAMTHPKHAKEIGAVTEIEKIARATAKKIKKGAKKMATKKNTVTGRVQLRVIGKKKATVKKEHFGTDAALRAEILKGRTNADALANVLKKFPKAHTTLACASWNRSQLRNNPKKYDVPKGTKVLTDAEARAK